MATKILNGPEGQTGPGKQVCTITGGTLLLPSMKLGPDGSNWELLTEGDIADLAQYKSFRHISKMKIDHLCSGKSGWAFTVFESSSPHGVAFLHIRSPAKLDAIMGDGAFVNLFTHKDLTTAYQFAQTASRSPRVWRRNVKGWDELAVNFCIKKMT